MRGVEATLIGEPADMVVIAPDDRPGVQRHALAVHRSRKRIAPFRLHIPTSAPEALSLLRERPRAWVLAGGIDVVNRMKSGDEPEDVVYIGRIDALRRITQSQDDLHIGATCTHHELATSPIAARAAPALPSVWGSLASPRIRFKGTVGGNLMANEPAYEGPSILSAMGADLRFLTPAGVRMVSCVEYFRARRQDPTWQDPTWPTRRGCSKRLSCRAIVRSASITTGLSKASRALSSRWQSRVMSSSARAPPSPGPFLGRAVLICLSSSRHRSRRCPVAPVCWRGHGRRRCRNPRPTTLPQAAIAVASSRFTCVGRSSAPREAVRHDWSGVRSP